MEARKKPKKPLALDEKLRVWEERFQVLTELTSEWYWEQDENCRFTLVTGGTLGHGIDTKNFLGTYRWDRGAVPAVRPEEILRVDAVPQGAARNESKAAVFILLPVPFGGELGEDLEALLPHPQFLV